MPTPNWVHWAGRNMRFWTPEQAICLSLNIDPDQPVPEHLCALHAERLRELQSIVEAKDYLLAVRNGKVDRFDFVFLVHQREEWEIPAELLRIAMDEPIPQRREHALAQPSSSAQFIQHTGKPARASRGEIVLSAQTPEPLPTRLIAAAFHELNGWNDKEWERNLADPPEWLKRARVTPGRRGRGGSATWNPVLIAVALADMSCARHKLNAVFKNPSMRAWVLEWDQKSEMLSDPTLKCGR